MSDELRTVLGLRESGGDRIEVRRIRLDFRHAVALLCVLALLLLGASGLTVVRLETDAALLDEEIRAVAFVPPPDERPTAELIAELQGEPAPSLFDRASRLSNGLRDTVRHGMSEFVRRHNEDIVTKAFFKADMAAPGQARAFLAAHKNNPYARALGYLGAARTAISEGGYYRADNIVQCGECWCWRERPVPKDDPTPTQ